jgi:hypothetical protein
MKRFSFPKTLITPTVLLSSALFCTTTQAALTDIGNGLIYDDVSNITWISDGHAFSNSIAGSTSNPTSNPYTGTLLGTAVTPSLGSPHAIAANDFSYATDLGRWVGSWWGASAWADSFTYQAGGQSVSDWRLPTGAEAQSLLTQLGSGWGAKAPFEWIPPFYWTSDLTNNGDNADVARPAFGTINNFTLMNGGVPRYSNVLAVVSGNVAAVPVPGAIWLFGSAIAAFAGFSRRKSAPAFKAV